MTFTAPLWFGRTDRPLFGWVTAPDGLQCRGGVVLCLPIGEEVRTTHRAMRKLAVELAESGLASILFDYDGTGDSAGMLNDPGRPDAWAASVAAAVGVLRRMGLPTVSAVGLRMGAIILTNSAPDLGLDAAVLWDPCLTGRHFIREQQALHRTGVVPPPPRTDDCVELPEYLLTARTAADVSAMRLLPDATPDATADASPMAPSPATRLLALLRPDRPVPAQLADWLAAHGAQTAPAPDQDTMLSDENGGYVPWPALGHIVGWISGVTPTATVQANPPGGELVATMPTESTARIRETITTIAPVGLFSIVAEPAEPRQAAATVVLISPSTEHHIGPARQWVELSRRWAAAGIRSVRFDLSGVGFSPTRAGQAEHEQYAREWLEDLPQVVADQADGTPVTLAGLCSGAYAALESGLALGVDAACAINPILTSSSFHTRSTMADPRRRVVRRIPFLLAWTQRHLPRQAWALWHLFTQLVPSRAPLAGIAAVARSGVATLVINSEIDATPFRRSLYWRYIGEPRLRRTTEYRMVVIPDADHALRVAHAREKTVGHIGDFVLSRYRVEAGGRTHAIP